MPGFNVKLNCQPDRNVIQNWYHGFPNALDDNELQESYLNDLVTHREVLMMRVVNTITDKPQWDQKVFDKNITTKWRDEIAQSGQDVTPKMMDWIIEELQWKANILKETGHVCVFDVGVIKSDTAVSKELQQSLKEAVKPLEDMPEKDYHPGSDNKVVDLVHPSLFPVIYGQTRVLPDRVIGLDDCLGSVGQGDLVPVPSSQNCGPILNSRHHYHSEEQICVFSDKFQWLPCDVEIIDDARCRIVSYINNAHPVHHKPLYEVVEKIIAQAIPLWNRSLSVILEPRMEYTNVEYGEHPEPEPVQPEGDDHDEDEFWELHEQWESTRPIIPPEPGSFQPRKEIFSANLREQFPGKKLQIIVKLANITLSPDNPEYEGGSWHIEGQLNERICATAIYYYDSENITDNSLAFRQRGMKYMLEIGYEQGQFEFLQAVFGFDDQVNGSGNNRDITQDLGAVACKEGRLLTFPNTVQHRVSPFSLVDPSKPGHRKILALFLVDPHRRIISSANVPPQQEDWGYERQDAVNQALASLPAELRDIVQDDLDPVMTMEKAKEYRLELMKERGHRSGKHNQHFETGDFNLCEH
ncbi:Protein of unknown function DUF4246 [Penicillium expansum]|uniref:Uncharacterized protein n=1 Tax=Penicillium expansum TaxID=27334 RepID=A0A0A2JFH8_PENEN|nr:Protein of unknown function DUF4246 [Penicillium expansum]KGO49193.1 Protein of unknown function DUF4246 [Penicillium expansum]KGO50742.1 Protein of unknown function DUF4246 [Penicillium expansum]KGO54124.1 Protein of unknown function DUF4246 [Penicillium expansum]